MTLPKAIVIVGLWLSATIMICFSGVPATPIIFGLILGTLFLAT